MPFITDQDNLGKALILNSSEKMAEFLNICRRWRTVTWEELDNIITVGVWDPAQQTAMFNEAHNAKASGSAMPYLMPGFLTRLRVAVSASFHIADKVGGVSGVGSMVFDEQAKMRSWKIYNPRILTANFREGNFGRFAGLPRKGKTNNACVWMEQWAADGNIAFSNILPDPDAPVDPRYQYVRDAMALFLAVSTLPEGVLWTFVHDEGGLMYSKADAATRRAKDLDKFARVIGKLHGNYIIIDQRPESVPTIIQDFATSLFYCEQPGVMDIELRGPNLAFRDRVRDFPKTTLPMQTYDIAFFNINVNIVKMLDALSGSHDVKETMREFLGTPEARKLPKGSYSASSPSSGRVATPDVPIKRVCPICGTEFEVSRAARNLNKRYDKRACYKRAAYERAEGMIRTEPDDPQPTEPESEPEPDPNVTSDD